MKNAIQRQEKWECVRPHWNGRDVPCSGWCGDFDKLKAFFYSRIHITMLISLFVCRRMAKWKSIFSADVASKWPEKRRNQIEKTIKNYERDNKNTINNAESVSTLRQLADTLASVHAKISAADNNLFYWLVPHETTAVAVRLTSFTSHLLKWINVQHLSSLRWCGVDG